MIKEDFLNKLHSWYQANKRDLPFRETTNPYFIWLSEIILQQTRVNQGLPYYYKFLKLFPTIQDLASASETDVMNAWQGLGYYSRAMNLHFTAKFVANELNGDFPTTYNELLKLKGVGDYTASAIASFSRKEVVPVLDGNVYRFMSRLYEIDTPINTPKATKEFKLILNELIDEQSPDVFNQAIIEFGALHCTPTSPNCKECVFNESCLAFNNQRVIDFPVKLKKKKPISRYLCFFAIKDNDTYYLTKRGTDSIWKNLHEFPYYESKECFDKEMLPKEFTNTLLVNNVLKEIKHILSHQIIRAKLFVCQTKEEFVPNTTWIPVSKEEIEDFPIHRLMEKIMEKWGE